MGLFGYRKTQTKCHLVKLAEKSTTNQTYKEWLENLYRTPIPVGLEDWKARNERDRKALIGGMFRFTLMANEEISKIDAIANWRSLMLIDSIEYFVLCGPYIRNNCEESHDDLQWFSEFAEKTLKDSFVDGQESRKADNAFTDYEIYEFPKGAKLEYLSQQLALTFRETIHGVPRDHGPNHDIQLTLLAQTITDLAYSIYKDYTWEKTKHEDP